MENLKLYTLANFFIIYNIIYLIPLHAALYIFYDPHPFALISSLLIFNFYSLLPSYSVGED